MLLAQTAMTAGFEIQAFPEYGSEKSGAPITAYARISESPIRIHSGIKNPGAVVVPDAGLMDVTAGLAEEEGLLLVNSGKDPDQVQENIKHDIARYRTCSGCKNTPQQSGDILAVKLFISCMV
jgi:pyruvate ferredoxin oxidoreductase gamma subunit